jgi:hypothetical protein
MPLRIMVNASTSTTYPIQPSNQWIPGALSPGIKRPGRESDHSTPTSAEVKKTWIYTSIVDHSGSAVQGMNRLRPLEHWGRGFESN